MTQLQLTAVFGVLLVLLGVIAYALARRTKTSSARPRGARSKRSAPAEQAPKKPELPSTPQPRKRRLVTDLPIGFDPLAAQAEKGGQASIFGEVERRLETAFEQLQLGEISLDTYRSIVRREETQVHLDIARLSTIADGEGAARLEEAQQAEVLIRYCLEWEPEQPE